MNCCARCFEIGNHTTSGAGYDGISTGGLERPGDFKGRSLGPTRFQLGNHLQYGGTYVAMLGPDRLMCVFFLHGSLASIKMEIDVAVKKT